MGIGDTIGPDETLRGLLTTPKALLSVLSVAHMGIPTNSSCVDVPKTNAARRSGETHVQAGTYSEFARLLAAIKPKYWVF